MREASPPPPSSTCFCSSPFSALAARLTCRRRTPPRSRSCPRPEPRLPIRRRRSPRWTAPARRPSPPPPRRRRLRPTPRRRRRANRPPAAAAPSIDSSEPIPLHPPAAAEAAAFTPAASVERGLGAGGGPGVSHPRRSARRAAGGRACTQGDRAGARPGPLGIQRHDALGRPMARRRVDGFRSRARGDPRGCGKHDRARANGVQGRTAAWTSTDHSRSIAGTSRGGGLRVRRVALERSFGSMTAPKRLLFAS